MKRKRRDLIKTGHQLAGLECNVFSVHRENSDVLI